MRYAKISGTRAAALRPAAFRCLAFLSLTALLGPSCGAEPASLSSVPSRSPPPSASSAALRASYLQSRNADAAHAFRMQWETPPTFVASSPIQELTATLDALTWTQQAVVLPADGAASDTFGFAVTVDGDTAVFATPAKTVGGNTWQGQAYVFVRSGATWTQQAVLKDPATGAANDFFGQSVSLRGNTVVIGAPGKTIGGRRSQGQAYIFVRSGAVWSQQAVLLDSATGDAGDRFGVAVALRGETVVIGAAGKAVGTHTTQGQAYVFVRSGTAWSQQAILVDSVAGATQDSYGQGVALSDDTAVVGAPFKTVGSHLIQGQAYVYVRSGTTWSQQAILVDSAAGADSDEFGQSLAISGDTVVVGAPLKTVGTSGNQGQAYVYVRSGTAWSPQAIFVDPTGGHAGEAFGIGVALSNDLAIIGAPFRSVGSHGSQGQAFVYVRSGTSWSPQAILDDETTGAATDFFGASVALSQDTVIIGAPYKTVGSNTNQGQGYVFTYAASPNGTACTMDSDCASHFCIDKVCCDTACGGGVTADCQSCSGAQTGGPDGTCAAISGAANHLCRPAVGVCDKPDFCDGLSNRCPTDELYQYADHYLCRAATYCAPASFCDGAAAFCPLSLCLPPRF